MREIAGAGEGVSDGLAASLDQPLRLGRIGEVGARALQAIGARQEVGQILGRIQMREGFSKRTRAEFG